MSDPAGWDARYAAGAAFGDAPNEYLRSIAWRLPAGARAWLPGDGDARNGVWLARQGFSVVSTDWSPRATAAARARAAAAGVAPEARLHDSALEARLGNGVPEARFGSGVLDARTQDVALTAPEAPFDLVAVIYLHAAPEQRAVLVRHVLDVLAPGGLLAIEAFRPAAPGQRRGGPPDPALLWSADLIATLFAPLETIELLEGLVALDEGPRHQGLNPVVRALLRRVP